MLSSLKGVETLLGSTHNLFSGQRGLERDRERLPVAQEGLEGAREGVAMARTAQRKQGDRRREGNGL